MKFGDFSDLAKFYVDRPGYSLDVLNCIQAEYYGAAEPPVRCGESHLSGLTEPLRSL